MTVAEDPLAGVKIVDMSMFLPGAHATQILFQLGAEVVKLEPPGGDPYRQLRAEFDVVNARKRNIQVDLKDPEERQLAYEVMRRSDVVVHNLRRSVAERLSVDFATVKRVNPSLIYCSIAGSGADTRFRDLPGHDINFLVFSGAAYKNPTLASRIGLRSRSGDVAVRDRCGRRGGLPTLALWPRCRRGRCDERRGGGGDNALIRSRRERQRNAVGAE